eukprot:3873834-Prymnesium_polylepis.1
MRVSVAAAGWATGGAGVGDGGWMGGWQRPALSGSGGARGAPGWSTARVAVRVLVAIRLD